MTETTRLKKLGSVPTWLVVLLLSPGALGGLLNVTGKSEEKLDTVITTTTKIEAQLEAGFARQDDRYVEFREFKVDMEERVRALERGE